MQYPLPNVIRTLYFQPRDEDVPEGGFPRHYQFRFNPLIPMDVQELTRQMATDVVFYSGTANFTGASSPSVGVFAQLYHVHNGVQLPMFSKPSPLSIAFGSGQRPNPFIPTAFVPRGDSITVEVRSQDRVNNLNVEAVLFGADVNWRNLTRFQKIVLDGKRRLLDKMVQTVAAGGLSGLGIPSHDWAGDKAPPGASPLVYTSTQQFPFPPPGAAPVTIFSYQVPPGQIARIFEHALVTLGGGIVDMTGNVIWRFLVNGWPLKGLGTQLSQIGTFSTPDKVVIWLQENDLFQVTVEVPATAPIQNGNTAYRINGWTTSVANQGRL